jgi:type IV pilus assembly protein PilO
MDLQNPKTQRILLSSLVSVVVLYLFFGSSMLGFSYKAQKAEIQQLQAEYDKLSSDLERARITARNLPKLEQEYEYLHSQWLIARNLLPEENDMEPLLRKISAAAQQAGLVWVEFRPEAPVQREFYTENPISIEVEGNFHQVGTFLGQVANLNRIVNVRNVKLEGVKAEQQGEEDTFHSLGGTMQIVAYTVPERLPTADSPKQNLDSADQRLGRAGNTAAAGSPARN